MNDIGLYCPFDLRVHSLAGEAEHNTLQWARQLGLIGSEQDAARLRLRKMGHLAARTHPDASPGSLRLIADWCSWFFEHDDICDEDLKHPEAAEAFHLSLKSIIVGGRQTSCALEVALLDLWDRTAIGAPPTWTQRFTRHLNEFFDYKVWEAQHRYQRVIPKLSTYIAERPAAAGMHVFNDLIEASSQRWLTTEMWQFVHTLRMLTARGCSWTNDIISFEREKAQGEVLNLVIVLMACGLDERSALAKAVKLHDDDVRTFGLAAEKIKQTFTRWDEQTQQTLEYYIEHLGLYMRGNIDWHAYTGRYLCSSPIIVSS